MRDAWPVFLGPVYVATRLEHLEVRAVLNKITLHGCARVKIMSRSADSVPAMNHPNESSLG